MRERQAKKKQINFIQRTCNKVKMEKQSHYLLVHCTKQKPRIQYPILRLIGTFEIEGNILTVT